jgi:nicotinamidase-related amidase/alkylated DNA repair dioxygenase AlkB
MFDISAASIPFLTTRQALLVLDLQNDLVLPGSPLAVDKPSDFLDKIAALVPEFRQTGNVMWVGTQFETHRPINDGTAASERIITDSVQSAGRLGSGGRRMPSKKVAALYNKMLAEGIDDPELSSAAEKIAAEEPHGSEAFLTIEPASKPRYLIPSTPGADYAPIVAQLADMGKDVFFTKSHYSAFASGSLLQTLRGQFVTELFICGALTNISVFATAMDAARYGFSITLVEDCLGYRSQARHDEAIRLLAEMTGCDMMSTNEVVGWMNQKNAPPQLPVSSRSPRDGLNRSLPDMLNNLNIRDGRRDDGTSARVPSKVKGRSRKSAPPIPVQHSTDSQTRVSDTESASKPPASTDPPGPQALPGALEGSPFVDVSKDGTESTNTEPKQASHHAVSSVSDESNVTSSEKGLMMGSGNKGFDQGAESGIMDERPIATHERPDADLPGEGIDAEKYSICEGDTTIINNLLADSEASSIFGRVRDEVQWQRMSHQGGEVPRLVAVQGEVGEDGSIPIYRHPADESPALRPFTSTVALIRTEVEKRLGHKVNHCLIQFYRSGNDYISEHSDKTLDIARDSFIANVSLGAQRVMAFRTKRPPKHESSAADGESSSRTTCKAPLHHNSLCKVGLRTNMKWLHSIRQDKRRSEEKTDAELAYDGGRISLTFRLIHTFLNKRETRIWGQGAVAKRKDDARTVVNGEGPEAAEMLRAFGKENQSSDFDWDAVYGGGFDVLHITNERRLFLSGDTLADNRVKLMMADLHLNWAEGQISPPFTWKGGTPDLDVPAVPDKLPIRFRDNDLSRSQVQGDLAILLYLDAVYGPDESAPSQAEKARQYTRLMEVDTLVKKWHTEPFSIKPFRTQLALWDTYAAEDLYIAGAEPSIADFALWPILHEIVEEWGEGIEAPHLLAYYERSRRRESWHKVFSDVKKEL